MKRKTIQSDDPDILGSYAALKRAAKRALRLGEQTGTPVYVMRKGKIVNINKKMKRASKRSRRTPL